MKSSKLTIWYVIDFYSGPNRGGTESQLLELICGLVDSGHDIRLFVFQHTDFTRSGSDFPCPIECLEIHSILSYETFRKSRSFLNKINKANVDAVHCFFNDAAIVVPLLSNNAKTVYFTSRRDMGYWYDSGRLAMLAVSNMAVDGIVCNSSAVAENVARREIFTKGKINIIHNSISRSFHGNKTLAKSPRDDSADTIRICLVASMKPIKRIHDGIKAVRQLVDEGLSVELVLVGSTVDIKYFEGLKTLIRKLSLAPIVRFVGETDNVYRELKTSDIGILTSESEGLSNALIEYLAAGLPVVCSNVGGNPELISDDHNGFLYAPGDIDALSTILSRLCKSEKLRFRLAATNLVAAQSYSLSALIHAHESMYRRTIHHLATEK